MAQHYKVPEDTSEKEKKIGGMLTAAQGGWMILGFLVTGGIFLLLAQVLSPLLALILGLIPGLGIAIPFAFIPVHGLSLATYLRLKAKFKNQPKQLVNTLTYEKKFNDLD